MAKRYSTTYSNGHTASTSNAFEANSWVNYGDQQTFALSGKSVSSEDFYATTREAIEAFYAKKNETHKRVRVLHGSSVASYVTKWVRR